MLNDLYNYICIPGFLWRFKNEILNVSCTAVNYNAAFWLLVPDNVVDLGPYSRW
jgi:hypothetical protein